MVTKDEIQLKSSIISKYLEDKGITIDCIDVVTGPRISLYKVFVKYDLKSSIVRYLHNDLAWTFNLKGVRVVTMDGGIGIEVANDEAEVVYLQSAMDSRKKLMEDMVLPIVLGYSTATQQFELLDLKNAPHLLVSGMTEQGVIPFLLSVIQSLTEVKQDSIELYICDPKGTLDSLYPMAKAVCHALQDTEIVMTRLCAEMERRIEAAQKQPNIAVVISELAELIVPLGPKERKSLSKSIYNSIIRLAQQGRQTGIHLIAATQRPMPEVLTVLLKSNFPTRIAFRTASKAESKQILDYPGAEALVGDGDMLFSCGGKDQRFQACICK